MNTLHFQVCIFDVPLYEIFDLINVHQWYNNNCCLVAVTHKSSLKVNRHYCSDPYVKLYLRKDTGERILKKKTHVRRATVNPVYNESFVFELPDSKLDNTVCNHLNIIPILTTNGVHAGRIRSYILAIIKLD
uniref:C2 domain-containing protein n=1 Tax=Heterorhabditis bacteriophora TaxID=37862 RepID=A0A1I7WRY5_HETBA